MHNKTMPDCTILPVLYYPDTEKAIEWLCRVFGFRERWRAGTHRAQLAYEQGVIVVTGLQQPVQEPLLMHSLLMRVKNVDEHYATALAGNAGILQPLADYFYGERQYTAVDIGGHQWTFSQTIKDLAPEEWGGLSAGR